MSSTISLQTGSQPVGWFQGEKISKNSKRQQENYCYSMNRYKPFCYSVFVTNLDLPAQHIWEMYKQRGDAENRIKELKYDFALETFCTKNFWGPEAAFRSVLMAYNMMALFRHAVLKSKSQATSNTLRFKCFALGAWTTRHARITT